uniref:Leucine rich repeat containing 57 n=1 Tax=Eptatretus burgeri TaxID=7764 RepID=A0A8C4QYM5_EPTBU
MGNSGLRAHLETAEKTGAFQLRGKNVSEFPEDLLRLHRKLRSVDLSENKLTSLPASVAQLKMLKILYVNQNRLGSLPQELCQLSKLEALYAADNRLTAMPARLGSLKALRTICLPGNSLTTFPLGLASLPSLDMLDLSRNHIQVVPDGVADLQTVELNLNQNQISRLSPELARCPRLKVLRLEENCLELAALPSDLLMTSTVSLLALDGNLFEMKQLRQLDGFEQVLSCWKERAYAFQKALYICFYSFYCTFQKKKIILHDLTQKSFFDGSQ